MAKGLIAEMRQGLIKGGMPKKTVKRLLGGKKNRAGQRCFKKDASRDVSGAFEKVFRSLGIYFMREVQQSQTQKKIQDLVRLIENLVPVDVRDQVQPTESEGDSSSSESRSIHSDQEEEGAGQAGQAPAAGPALQAPVPPQAPAPDQQPADQGADQEDQGGEDQGDQGDNHPDDDDQGGDHPDQGGAQAQGVGAGQAVPAQAMQLQIQALFQAQIDTMNERLEVLRGLQLPVNPTVEEARAYMNQCKALMDDPFADLPGKSDQ